MAIKVGLMGFGFMGKICGIHLDPFKSDLHGQVKISLSPLFWICLLAYLRFMGYCLGNNSIKPFFQHGDIKGHTMGDAACLTGNEKNQAFK